MTPIKHDVYYRHKETREVRIGGEWIEMDVEPYKLIELTWIGDQGDNGKGRFIPAEDKSS